MKLASEQQIAAPRERVWEALNDPDILRASIPGCQGLDKETNDRFTATVEVKVGPIGARFKGIVSLADLDPPNGYTLNLEGNGGIAGSAKGSAKVRLRENAGGTLVTYDVDAQVGGRMAQLGGPIIDATSKQLAGKFFSRFGEIVGGKNQAGAIADALARPSGASGGTSVDRAPVPTAQAARPVARPSALPLAWILAVVVAALAGFLMGRGAGGAGSDWAGLAIGLLVIVVAGAAFAYGRSMAAAPVVTLDIVALRRLIEGAKE